MIDPAVKTLIELVARGVQQQIDLQGYYPPVHEIAALMVAFGLTQSAEAIATTLHLSKDARFDYMLLLIQQRDSLFKK